MSLILKKSGFWNNDDSKFFLSPNDVAWGNNYRRVITEIEDGFSLRDLARCLQQNPTFESFLSIYNYSNITKHNEYIKEQPKVDRKNPPPDTNYLDYIEVGMFTTLNTSKGCYTVKPFAHGKFYGNSDPYSYNYNNPEIFDIQLKILDSHKFQVYKTEHHRPIKIVEPKCKIYMNLLDFCDAIYEELTFYGSPEQSKQAMTDLREDVEGIMEKYNL